MRVLVCGGRDFNNWQFLEDNLDAIRQEFEDTTPITVLVHGCAFGADRLAEKWAILNGIPAVGMAADWKTHGKAAGPIRNQSMLTEGKPDLVVAFAGGRGTADMVRRAKAANVEVREIN